MTLLRRFLVLVAFAFWLGGFAFYAGVVVPIGTDVLGGSGEQARITRRVVQPLNLACATALGVFALDWLVNRDRGRAVLWLFVLACLCVLLWMYPRLDALFAHGEGVDDRSAFRPWHRTYLWVSTLQWAAACGYGVLTLAAWRAEDRRQ